MRTGKYSFTKKHCVTHLDSRVVCLCLSLCWSQVWALQKQLNWSRCRSRCELLGANGTMYWAGTVGCWGWYLGMLVLAHDQYSQLCSQGAAAMQCETSSIVATCLMCGYSAGTKWRAGRRWLQHDDDDDDWMAGYRNSTVLVTPRLTQTSVQWKAIGHGWYCLVMFCFCCCKSMLVGKYCN